MPEAEISAAASRTFGARRFFELTFKPLNLRSGLIQFRLEVNALPIRLLKLVETGRLLLKLPQLRFCLFAFLLGALKFTLRCFQTRLRLRKLGLD